MRLTPLSEPASRGEVGSFELVAIKEQAALGDGSRTLLCRTLVHMSGDGDDMSDERAAAVVGATTKKGLADQNNGKRGLPPQQLWSWIRVGATFRDAVDNGDYVSHFACSLARLLARAFATCGARAFSVP